MALQKVSPLLLSASEVAAAAPGLMDIIDLVLETYRMEADGGVDVPPKVGVHPKGGAQSFLHAMPAWVKGNRALGVKWVSFFPGNAEAGLPDSTGLIVLNDPDSGLPVAIMEGMWITYARTTACMAVAARLLANPEPRTLGLVGCGGLADWSLRMLSVLYPSIREVRVASVRPESRKAFCEARRGDRWTIEPVETVREAVEGMDLVISSTPKLKVHPIRAEWWAPGSVLIPLDVTGAWDDSVFTSADHVVSDSSANLERAFERYRPALTLDTGRLTSLQELVAGRARGRLKKTDRILAVVTGIASPDMTIAWAVYRRALAAGQGRRFDMTA